MATTRTTSDAEVDAIVYPKAPILEAVVDVQVRIDRADAMPDLIAFRDELQGEFANAVPIQTVEFKVGAPPDQNAVAATSAAQIVGWRLTNSSGSRVLQIQQRGFTFSHLAPYSDWISFEAECRPLWAKFVLTCKPAKVVRLALRYINKIVVPEQRFEPQEYFTIYPNMPDTVPDAIAGLFMQVQIPQLDLAEDVVAAVTVALMNRERPGETPVLLDIDLSTVRREIDPSSGEVWDTLRQFRRRKNLLFESFITNKTRDLFQ